MRAVERAYAAIREGIVTGGFAPGARLREEELARIVGASRTPVREALRRLQADGFVDFHPNRGARVPYWSRQDLHELFGLRTVLESYAARLAAEHVTEAELDSLDKLADEMVAVVREHGSGALETVAVLNNRFHETILRASQNDRLVAIIGGLVQLPIVVRAFQQYSEESVARSLGHHRELVAAFRAGNREWAAAVMRSHIEAAYTALLARQAEQDANGDGAEPSP